MSGISQLLESARRALLAQQYGMSVTGHNIANASTPGYSRQRADLVTTWPNQTTAGLLGTGVMVQGVTRLRNAFVDQQIRSSNDTLGMANSEYAILSQVEATFSEPSTSGLSGVMSRFFQAWNTLSTNPEDPVSRNALLLQGKEMANTFHRLNADMTALRGSLRTELTTKIDRINTLAEDISKLNVDITSTQAAGLNPGDMQDLRDLKLEELSTLANITVTLDGRGSATVSLGGTVVAGNGTHLRLKAVAGDPVTIAGASFDQVRIVAELGGDVALSGGEVAGILKSYNTSLPDSIGRLDRLAEAVIREVNRHHSAGYGIQNPPRNGINFFFGTGAASIGIDLTDTSGGAAPGSAPSIDNIATTTEAGVAGKNDIALLIAGALDRTSLSDGAGGTLLNGLSIGQYYNQIVTRVGSSVNAADTVAGSAELVIAQLTQQRESVSGVSLDEEMTNMIKYQRAFDAAARVVNSVNEMFDTLLTMV